MGELGDGDSGSFLMVLAERWCQALGLLKKKNFGDFATFLDKPQTRGTLRNTSTKQQWIENHLAATALIHCRWIQIEMTVAEVLLAIANNRQVGRRGSTMTTDVTDTAEMTEVTGTTEAVETAATAPIKALTRDLTETETPEDTAMTEATEMSAATEMTDPTGTTEATDATIGGTGIAERLTEVAIAGTSVISRMTDHTSPESRPPRSICRLSRQKPPVETLK